jgi:transposase
VAKVENGLFKRQYDTGPQADLFHDKRLDVVFFDTTSIKLHHRGQGGLFQHGYSKDHRPDLLQVMVGVVMTSAHDPICHYVFPGNTADTKAFTAALRDVKKRFPLRRVILVADGGCAGRDITAEIRELGLDYIVGARLRSDLTLRERVINARGVIGKWSIYDDKLTYKDVTVDDERYILVKNSEAEARDIAVRNAVLAKLKEKEGNSLKGLVKNRKYKQFLATDGEIRIDPERVALAARFDGLWALRSNIRDFAATDLIEGYKTLWRVEQWFDCLKSRLDAAPVFHWSERRVRAHIAVCFLAMKVWSVFRNALDLHLPGDARPFDRWRALGGLKGAVVTVQGNSYLVRAPVPEDALPVFAALGTAPPKRIQNVAATPQDTHARKVASTAT